MHTVQLIALACAFLAALYGVVKKDLTALSVATLCLVLVEALDVLPAK